MNDTARLDEWGLVVGQDALLTLEQTAESEGLFEGKFFVAEAENVVRRFVAYDEQVLTWLLCQQRII